MLIRYLHAYPGHGCDVIRPRLYIRNRCSSSCRPEFAIVALISLILLPGCDETDNQAASEQASAPAVSIQTLLEELTQDDESFEAPADPHYPADLLMHPAVRAESFSLRAIVYPGDSADDKIDDKIAAALQASIERVALRANGASAEKSGADNNVSDESSIDVVSRWSFNNVMRVNVMTDAGQIEPSSGGNVPSATDVGDTLLTLAQHPPRQSVQRAALQLAGVESRRLWVGGDELLITPRSERQGDCQMDYSWSSDVSADQRAELTFSFDTCPRSLAISGLASWQASAIAFTGNIVTKAPINAPGGALTDAPGNSLTNVSSSTPGNVPANVPDNAPDSEPTRVPVNGFVWVTYSWGNPPAGVGAVVFDTLTLRLDNGDVLDVNRSKRVSGSGPRTITATLYGNGVAPRDIDIDWEDGESEQAASGQSYPRTIRLVSEDGSLTGSVTPLNRLQENTGPGNSSLSVAVVFEGENAGVGFLSYSPVNAMP